PTQGSRSPACQTRRASRDRASLRPRDRPVRPQARTGRGRQPTLDRRAQRAWHEQPMNHLDANLIIANAPDPVFVSDFQGKILLANEAVSELLGFRKDEVLEQSLSRFVSLDEARELMVALREVVEHGVSRNVRLNPHSASGEVIPTTLNASALRGPRGEVIGVIGILRDMRELDKARAYAESLIKNAPDPVFVSDLQGKILQANDAVYTLLGFRTAEVVATLSHELRTPLNAILGWVRLLRSGTLDAAGASRGPEVIERNTRLLAQLIEDLLDVSRIITGKLRLDVGSIDLVSVIVAAMEAVQTAADAKGIRLETSLDPALGPVSADPSRLQQVVWNLLTNAIKFTPAGGRVDIRLERHDSMARVTVSDTGQGIRRELLPFVFDRFRQGETSIGRRYGGLGLGLAIVRHIVELHGGDVNAESAGEGRGAIFTVDLPLTATHADTIPPEPARRRLDREPVALDGLRVL